MKNQKTLTIISACSTMLCSNFKLFAENVNRKLFIAITLLIFFSSLSTANAATLTVTNTNDAGPGSLWQALQDSRSDTVAFAPGVTGTISLSSHLPEMRRGVNIIGPGADLLTINGGSTETMALLSGSPCINTGLTYVSTDQRGIARPQRSAADLGAVESIVTCPPANIIYVNANASGANNGTSWNDAFNYLQDALASQCPLVTQIWVASGTYFPDEGAGQINNSRISAFALKNGIAVYGGFAGTETLLSQRNWTTNATVLSGDIGAAAVNTDNSYHVIFNNRTSSDPLTSSAILDGCTITGGYANAAEPNNKGGGMYNLYASPTISHCIFSDNSVVRVFPVTTSGSGGGMYNSNSSPNVSNCIFSDNKLVSFNNSGSLYGGGIFNSSSSSIISNCSFTNNKGTDPTFEYSFGGGIYNLNSSPVINGCNFSGNAATFGGGIYNSTSPLSITYCTFSNNQIYPYPGGVNGAAINTEGSAGTVSSSSFLNNNSGGVGSISISGSSIVDVTRCTFSGNSYGIANQGAAPVVTNCLFTNNAYGGIVNWVGNNSSPSITNCTFSENPGSVLGAISNYGTSSATLKNCIIWGAGNSVYNPQGGTVSISFSDIKLPNGVYTGTGNLNTDPLFVSATDFHLQSGSPAINAGTNTNAPSIDIEGNPRVLTVSNPTDMGAYESLTCPVITPVISGILSFCAGSSTTLNAGVFTSYNWSTGATTQTISVNTIGTFTVTVTNASGCTGTASATTSAFVAPVITGNLTPCIGSSTTLSTGVYNSYLWSTGATTQSVTVTANAVYKVTVTNAGGCTGSTSAKVVKKARPTFTLNTVDTNLCPPVTSVALSLIGNAASYAWSPATGLNQTTGTSVIATPLVTTSYYVTATGTNGCTISSYANVNIKPKPILLTTTAITANSATLNWKIVDCATGYTVQYRLAGGTWLSVPVSTNIGIKVLNGLLASSSYQWRIKAKYPNGTTSKYTNPVSFTTPALRMGETVTVNALQVYPNPASDKLTLEFPFTEGDATITVVNALGQTVLTQKATETDGVLELNIQSFTEGLYFVTVKNGDNIFNSRFVKK